MAYEQKDMHFMNNISENIIHNYVIFFFKISASLSYQRMLRHWTALHPGVVVVFRPI